MAFLFKSKKHQDKASGALKDANGPPVSQQQNGRGGKDAMTDKNQTTPASSVNNSMNSLGEKGTGAMTPSPEQANAARMAQSGGASDLPVGTTHQMSLSVLDFC